MEYVDKGAMMITALPRFACRFDKRPLTAKGFYDARVDVDHSGWRLVGVPTGEVSGFDCLDIDPEGVGWYDLNFDALPQTRAHETRRGLHLLFKHAEGLKGSVGRIAKGLDVRADGNYIIWWPEAGLPFEDNPICEWPAWLLDLALPPPGAQRRGGDGIIDDGAMAVASAPDGVVAKNQTLDFRRRSKSILRKLEHAKPGNRNNTLHWAACRFGEMIIEGLVMSEVAVAVLESAARVCRLVNDDGLDRVRATIKSGLVAGAMEEKRRQRMPKGKGEKGLARRVSAVERKVDQLTRTVPELPTERASGEAASAREAEFAQTLARLGGRSTAGLTPDDLRGSTSPIGMGSYSKPRRR